MVNGRKGNRKAGEESGGWEQQDPDADVGEEARANIQPGPCGMEMADCWGSCIPGGSCIMHGWWGKEKAWLICTLAS